METDKVKWNREVCTIYSCFVFFFFFLVRRDIGYNAMAEPRILMHADICRHLHRKHLVYTVWAAKTASQQQELHFLFSSCKQQHNVKQQNFASQSCALCAI